MAVLKVLGNSRSMYNKGRMVRKECSAFDTEFLRGLEPMLMILPGEQNI